MKKINFGRHRFNLACENFTSTNDVPDDNCTTLNIFSKMRI